MEIELERTFLLKYKPEGLEKSPFVEITDIYFPENAEHSVLRLRNRGNEKFEMTKKICIDEKDKSEMEEHTIILSEEEYKSLAKAGGKKVVKARYYYDMPGGERAEVDIFKDKLVGLVLVDFEFNDKKKKDDFVMPEFCLADVSQDEWLAGGILAGKGYKDIQKFLDKAGYKIIK